ncbi:hypothetical protein LOTGIDRAFT_229491 [Lottia gigantea]|uniref:Myb/SANT-like DNA-binding domain-containing protein n=1 Tax=Lottia gigantea TaxID=225164 RepID=V3ZSZ6_LOTGI|nr:hypothetical protein LOTGIDRAFT_229491 [Lottia gigantea]ESO85695.1 hypothetical protein LOTGIDRAFT_229491 [Lottia gigantea]
MSSGGTRLTFIIKRGEDAAFRDFCSFPTGKATPDTWGLISKTLNQQDRKIKKYVGQIKKKWNATNRLPRRDLLEKLAKSKNGDLYTSDVSDFNDSLEEKRSPKTSSVASETIILSPKTFCLGTGESGSMPSSISFADGTLSSQSDGLMIERQNLQKEIQQLREENKMYQAAKAALVEKRKKLSRERQVLASQRKKLEYELCSPPSFFSPSYSPKQWATCRPGW